MTEPNRVFWDVTPKIIEEVFKSGWKGRAVRCVSGLPSDAPVQVVAVEWSHEYGVIRFHANVGNPPEGFGPAMRIEPVFENVRQSEVEVAREAFTAAAFNKERAKRNALAKIPECPEAEEVWMHYQREFERAYDACLAAQKGEA